MNKKQYALMNWEQIESIVYADCSNPFSILGLHTKKKEVILQAFFPEAEKVFVNLYSDATKKTKRIEMEMVDDSGFFATFLTKDKFDSYTYTVEYMNVQKKDIKDPYAFPVTFDDKATASVKRGTNENAQEFFGAKLTKMGNTEGVLFTVYAPKAERISILGDFNNFREGSHLMEKNESTGVFALFVPGVTEGCKYRYSIKGRGLKSVEKADPFALCQDGINGVVTDLSSLKKAKNHKGVAIKNPAHLYEVDLFSLMDEKTESCMDLLPVLIKHCKEYSYTGIHIISLFEQTKDATDRFRQYGMYAVSALLGGPKTIREFVNALHEEGLSVSTDFNIAFFTGCEEGLHFFDGSALFESAEERVMYQPGFGGFGFDFSNGFVQSYLLSAALHLIKTIGIDGLEIPNLSAVLYLDYGKRDGEWIPNEYGGNLNLAGVRFLKKLNTKLEKSFPNVTRIASSDGVLENVTAKNKKESLQFDLVRNTGFENEIVSYLQNDPFFRSEHYYELQNLVQYAFAEDFILPVSFLSSSKDFVSFVKRMPGTYEDKVRNAVLATAFMTIFPGKKLHFMGSDTFCEDTYLAGPYAQALKEAKNLEGAIRCVKDLNAMYLEKSMLHPTGESEANFRLIKSDDPSDNVLIFERSEGENIEYIICNFSNKAIEKYSFGLPKEGKIKEIFTMADEKYALGEAMVNRNAISTKEIPMDNDAQSVTVKIPAMGMQIFHYRPFTEKEKEEIARKKYLEKVRYVQAKKKEIEEERDRIIAAATKEAARKIKELEKILK